MRASGPMLGRLTNLASVLLAEAEPRGLSFPGKGGRDVVPWNILLLAGLVCFLVPTLGQVVTRELAKFSKT